MDKSEETYVIGRANVWTSLGKAELLNRLGRIKERGFFLVGPSMANDNDIAIILGEPTPPYPEVPISDGKSLGANVKKPPLGVKPEKLYEEQRIMDLARAIDQRLEHLWIGNDIQVTVTWCEELARRIKAYSERG